MVPRTIPGHQRLPSSITALAQVTRGAGQAWLSITFSPLKTSTMQVNSILAWEHS
jgi:hypothetical protein